MSETEHWYEGVAIPYLLRLARGSYGERSRSLLAQAGFDDLPRNAGFILTDLVGGRRALSDVVAELFVGRPAASAMVDTLVLRGYVERHSDPKEPGRPVLELTERGRAATDVIQTAVDQIDEELEKRLSPEELAGLRAGLAALHEIRNAG
jgi:DNA-binding MarR family transcriptional regulator